MYLSRRLKSVLLTLVVNAVAAARADVTPAAVFTDRAVLQRDKPVPVWGNAEPGEKVSVHFAGQKREATTGADGRWMVYLDSLAAESRGAELTIAGKNTIVLRDVVVGDVWLCAGGLLMEWPVGRARHAEQEIASANFPLLRHLRIARTTADAPATLVKKTHGGRDALAAGGFDGLTAGGVDALTAGGFDGLTAGWRAATPQSAGEFTAVGYFFGREIHAKAGVPIGLVHSSWADTPIEAWMSPAALASDPNFARAFDRWQQTRADSPARRKAPDERLAPGPNSGADARAGNAPASAAAAQQNPSPGPPRGPGDPWAPAAVFNGMIDPLLPYAIRGVLWYHGERNADRASEYHALFAALIRSWRAHFGQGDIPFYWVNPPNFAAPSDPTGRAYAFLREAQTKTLALANTGQVVAIDLVDARNLHPPDQQEVARRLALLAKNRDYGIVLDDTGPTFAGATREGATLRVRFAHAGHGLIARDKPVQSLELAGPDRVFHPAQGRIERHTLVVTSPRVREPVAVRYAWTNAPEANLYNGAGLPAVPFRSDDW
jgi:sialate O-acetylesterase